MSWNCTGSVVAVAYLLCIGTHLHTDDMSYGGYGLKLPNVGQAPTFFSDVRIAYRTEQFLVQKHSYIHKCVFVFFCFFKIFLLFSL